MKITNLFLVIALLVCSSTAFSWGDLGHQTVAEIAQRNLTPAAKQGVQNILGPEPLAGAATWPDMVRSDRRFSAFSLYHFAEVPEGKSYETMTAKEHPEKDAFTVISKYPGILKDPSATREQKMIALRYIIHVVGDVHQPLHVGNGIDMGANLCETVWTDPLTKVVSEPNLHAVWDETIIEYYRSTKRAANKFNFFGYDKFADDILKTADVPKSEYETIQNAEPLAWLAESVALRKSVVYPDGELSGNVKDEDRAYCGSVKSKKVVKSEDRPQISLLYAEEKLPIVKTRILKGGLRLAALLNKLFSDTKASLPTDMEIINSLQLQNSND